MSKAGSASKVKINSFDDLFGASQAPAGTEQVREIPLSELHEFKGHPFKVLDDEKMQETVESIRNYGVLMPGIARPRAGGGYEIIAGHRRKHGCELAGLSTMPMFVRDYSDDEATVIMVDTNIQREDILPSEKARAYTFDITMAIFDVGNHIVTKAAGVITGNASIDVTATLQTMFNTQLSTMGIGELIGLGIETMIVSLCMKIMSVLITVILYGRMIEIYLYVSVAPVPFATLSNREWGSIGSNYIKGLCALAFQGFFIMVCVGIYSVLVSGVAVAGNLHSALWSVAAYTVILCFSLFKTGSLSKSIFNAH